MEALLQPILTVGSAAVIVLTIVYYNRSLYKRIDDTRIELKDDIKANSDKIDSTRLELKRDNQALRSELKGDNQALRSELKSDNQALRSELKSDNQALRSELKGDIQRNGDKIDATRELLYSEISDTRSELNTKIEAASKRANEANDLVRDLSVTVADLGGEVRVLQHQVRRVEEKIDERERIEA